jgi:DNA replication protein DnaC
MKYNKYTNQQLDSKILSNAKLSIQYCDNNMMIYLSSTKNKNEYVLSKVNTKIYCASKKEGKLSITLPDYCTNLLINSADEDEIDSFVNIIANRYNNKKENIENKENINLSKLQQQQSYNIHNNNNNKELKERNPLSSSSVFKLMCLGGNKQSNHSPTKSKIKSLEGNNRKKIINTTPEKQISTPPKKLNHQRYSPNTKNISSGGTPIKKKIKMNLTHSKFILSKSPCNSPIKNILKNKNLFECNSSIVLTEEQNKVIETCLIGTSCFITGVAGTGKSMLLNHIVLELEKKIGKQGVFVTATTGLAACLIGGTTIHQFAGINGFCLDLFDDKEDDFEEIVLNSLSKKSVVLRWRQARTLLVDEISMLNPKLLELLNEIAQKARGNLNNLYSL